MCTLQVTQEVREATLTAVADIPGQEIDMPPPPGGCYVQLLHTIDDTALSGNTISGVSRIIPFQLHRELLCCRSFRFITILGYRRACIPVISPSFQRSISVNSATERHSSYCVYQCECEHSLMAAACAIGK